MRNSGKIIFAVMLLVSMLPLTSCGKSEAPGLSSGGVGGNEGGTSEEYKYPKPSQSAIRLMTYNSYYCRGNTGTPAVSQTNTENFARVIKTLDADIVAIQELDKGALNRNKRDLLQEIADATGIDYQVVFAPAADYMGGKIGPIRRILQNHGGADDRLAGRCVLHRTGHNRQKGRCNRRADPLQHQ